MPAKSSLYGVLKALLENVIARERSQMFAHGITDLVPLNEFFLVNLRLEGLI